MEVDVDGITSRSGRIANSRILIDLQRIELPGVNQIHLLAFCQNAENVSGIIFIHFFEYP